MTLDEIKGSLHRLRYDGKWSIRGLAKQSGLSVSTISLAMEGNIGEQAQARLSVCLPVVPRRMPVKAKPPSKKKPGHMKRYLIRYYNLMRWLDAIEQERGILKRFPRDKQGKMSRDRAAYVCARLDYQMKHHLLTLYGERLRQKKVVLGDCYPAEKWIEKIRKTFPGDRVLMFSKITKRK